VGAVQSHPPPHGPPEGHNTKFTRSLCADSVLHDPSCVVVKSSTKATHKHDPCHQVNDAIDSTISNVCRSHQQVGGEREHARPFDGGSPTLTRGPGHLTTPHRPAVERPLEGYLDGLTDPKHAVELRRHTSEPFAEGVSGEWCNWPRHAGLAGLAGRTSDGGHDRAHGDSV
jgi:hypothetical protein